MRNLFNFIETPVNSQQSPEKIRGDDDTSWGPINHHSKPCYTFNAINLKPAFAIRYPAAGITIDKNNFSSPFDKKMIQTAADGPCSADSIQNLPIPEALLHGKYKPNKNGDTIVLGIEGSANKVGVGVLKYSPLKQGGNDDSGSSTEDPGGEPAYYHILSNPRKTYIAPTGQGFLPKQTATHHQNHIVALVRAALSEAFPGEEHPETLISASE